MRSARSAIAYGALLANQEMPRAVGHIKRLCCSGVLGLNAPHGRSPHRLDNVRRRPFLDNLHALRHAAMARSDIAPAACSSAIVLPRCARWFMRAGGRSPFRRDHPGGA
jgi:hypothetical protein